MSETELARYLRSKGKRCFAATRDWLPCSRWPAVGVYCRQHAALRGMA